MRIGTKSSGFTLIELTIVVAIIGILAAIAIPNYMRFTSRAKEAVIYENMHTMQLAIEDFSLDQLGIYPQPADVAALKILLPQGVYPDNPFTQAETVVAWNADPGAPGEISIFNLPGGGYRLRALGESAFLTDVIQGD